MSTPEAPSHPRLPERVPTRSIEVTEGARLARAPLPGHLVLTVAREGGPSFHRSELNRLQHMLDVLQSLTQAGLAKTVQAQGTPA